ASGSSPAPQIRRRRWPALVLHTARRQRTSVAGPRNHLAAGEPTGRGPRSGASAEPSNRAPRGDSEWASQGPPPSSDDAGTTRRSEERTERSGPATVRTATHAIQTDTQRPKPVTSDPTPGRPTEKSRQIARVHSGKFACRYLETVADPAVGR